MKAKKKFFFRQTKAERIYCQKYCGKRTVKGSFSGKRKVTEKNLNKYKEYRSGENDGFLKKIEKNSRDLHKYANRIS